MSTKNQATVLIGEAIDSWLSAVKRSRSNWKSVNGEFDLAPETWVLTDCYGNIGNKTLQTSNGSSDNGLPWFSPQPSWTNKWGTCADQASATFPLTVTVPPGESIRIGGCY